MKNAFIVVAYCLVTSNISALAAPIPNGEYIRTDFGPVKFLCVAHEFCIGIYESPSATTGYVYLNSEGSRDGQFSGYWAQPISDTQCPRENHFPFLTTKSWGKAQFQFSSDSNSWTGNWGYCDEAPTKTWNGKKAVAQTPPAKNDSNYTVLRCEGNDDSHRDGEFHLRMFLHNSLLRFAYLEYDRLGVQTPRPYLFECDDGACKFKSSNSGLQLLLKIDPPYFKADAQNPAILSISTEAEGGGVMGQLRFLNLQYCSKAPIE